jgi:hypothetical protein
MVPKPAAYYAAALRPIAPGRPPTTPLRWHFLLSLMIGLMLWSVLEQRWVIAAGLAALIAMLGVIMARKLHGKHLPPSLVLVVGMVVTLSLPFTELVFDPPWLSIGVFVAGTVVPLASMRLDEKKRHHQLVTGDFNDSDLW